MVFQLIGRKRFYMSCVALFTISSFLCGLAPSLSMLIIFRVLQGVGGGGLQPSEQAILADTFRRENAAWLLPFMAWRCEHHRHAVDGERHAALARLESVGEDRLLARLQAAAADALQHAEEESAQPRVGASPQRNELTVKSATQVM